MDEPHFETVSITDPAIDIMATPEERIVQFAKTRDMSHLTMKPDVAPAIFVLRAIPHSVTASYVALATNEEQRRLFAFRAALIEARNVVATKVVAGVRTSVPLGAAWKPELVAMRPAEVTRAASLLSDAEAAQFSWPLVQEVGAVAYWHSCFFHLATAPSCPLPPLSADIWDATHTAARVLSAHTAAPGPSSPPDGEPASWPPAATAASSG